MGVLILTNNLLADTELQYSLQRLNKEVFCSNHLLDSNEEYSLLKYFSTIIFSDTISNLELSDYLMKINGSSFYIIRKATKFETETFDFNHRNNIDEWVEDNSFLIDKVMCVELSRDSFQKSKSYSEEDSDDNFKSEVITLFISSLSKNEKRALYHIYNKRGDTISREELRECLWGKRGISINNQNSQLAQISTLVKGIKNKMELMNINSENIKTSWGTGYYLSISLVKALNRISFCLL